MTNPIIIRLNDNDAAELRHIARAERKANNCRPNNLGISDILRHLIRQRYKTTVDN